MNLLYVFGLVKGIRVGEWSKSWDVLESVRFIEANFAPEDPILDIGAYMSEIPAILHRLGYTNLFGIDLDPKVMRMPYSDTIHYRVGNFLETPYSDETFAGITAISVIEHGYDGKTLFSEVSRLLRPGGSFLASFDYWPEKVETPKPLFGMDWKIFSRAEVQMLVDEGSKHGLLVEGDLDVADLRKPAISRNGISYTFAWLAFKKAIGVSASEPATRERAVSS